MERNIKTGDEIEWRDGSRSVAIGVEENRFAELTQFGNIYLQCFPDPEEECGYRLTGRHFNEIDDVLNKMREASKVDEL
jgi:hypothetical protein